MSRNDKATGPRPNSAAYPNLLHTALTTALAIALTGCFTTGVKDSVGLAESNSFKGLEAANILSPTAIQFNWSTSGVYSKYLIYTDTSSSALAETPFGNYTLSGLSPNTSYRFSVGGVSKESTTDIAGTQTRLNITTWMHFTGAATVATPSTASLQVNWNYVKSGPTFKVYVKTGGTFTANDPALQTPAARTTDFSATITKLADNSTIQPNTTYYVIVRATYLDGTSEANMNVVQAKTPSDINPLPTVTTDRVILGRWPIFNITGGLSTYTTTFVKGTSIIGTIFGNGTYNTPTPYPIALGDNTISVAVNADSSLAELDPLSVHTRMFDNVLTEFYSGTSGKGYQRLGAAMASGDFNCDGFADLAIGAPEATAQPQVSLDAQDGAVYIFYGTNLGLKTSPAPSTSPAHALDPLLLVRPPLGGLNSTTANLGFGTALAAGNLNADMLGITHCDDLVVGTKTTNSKTNIGEVWVFFGGADGFQLGSPEINNTPCSSGICVPLIIYPPTGTYSGQMNFGASLAIGRLHEPVDANDKYLDLIIGAPSDTTALHNGTGAIWIYYGGSNGLKFTGTPNGSPYPFTIIYGPAETDISLNTPLPYTPNNFGLAVAAVNLDGDADKIDDIVVGAPLNAVAGLQRGKVYYYSSVDKITPGSGAFPHDTTPTSSLTNPTWPQTDYTRFGGSLANVGDLNKDGIPDLAIGNGNFTFAEWMQSPSEVHMVYGSITGWQTSTCKSNRTAVGATSACTTEQTQSCSAGTCSIMNIAYNPSSNPGALSLYPVAVKSSVPRAGAISGADFNNDTYHDLAIGFPLQSYAASEGQVYYGSVNGIQVVPSKLKPTLAGPWDNLGSAIVTGNFNGDVYTDIVISAPENNTLNGTMFGGVAFEFNGKLGGLPGISSTENLRLTPSNSREVFADFYVQPMGDLNGDGYDDAMAMITKPYRYFSSTLPIQNTVQVAIYFGSANGLITTPAPSLNPGTLQPALLPDPIAGMPSRFDFIQAAGDINADNYDDVVLIDKTNIYVYYGSASGLQSAVFPIVPPTQGLNPVIVAPVATITVGYNSTAGYANQSFKSSSLTNGDFNNDGYNDIALANGTTWASDQKNMVLIIYGSAGGIQTDGVLTKPNLTTYTPATNIVFANPCTNGVCSAQWLQALGTSEGFGTTIANAGDVNNDGFDDLLVGAPYKTQGVYGNYGAAYLYLGSPTGLLLNGGTRSGIQIIPRALTEASNRYAGKTVAPAGDLNKDGYDDIIIGATGDTSSIGVTGGAYVIFGCGNGLNGGPTTPSCPSSGLWGVTSGTLTSPPLRNSNTACSNGSCSILYLYPTGLTVGNLGYQITYFAGGPPPSWGAYAGSVGDLNKDGYNDIIIGTTDPLISCNSTACPSQLLRYAGVAVIYTGIPGGVLANANATLTPSCSNGACTPYLIHPDTMNWGVNGYASADYFGRQTVFNLKQLFDFNGDSYNDIIINARTYKNAADTTAFTGGFYVFK